MAGDRDDDFEALLEQSSLGSPAARRLRERTPPKRASFIRMITELRGEIAHPGDEAEEARAARDLEHLLRTVGYRAQVEVPHRPRDPAHSHAPAPAKTVLGTVDTDDSITEIEMCGELIIAASSEPGVRLSLERIDEVLGVRTDEDSTAH